MSPLLLLTLTAQAACPLVPAFETLDTALRAWWRPGELFVAPGAGDPRPGFFPLNSRLEGTAPPAGEGWRRLGERCDPAATATFTLQERPAVASLEGDWMAPILRVRVGERIAAELPIGHPAHLCALYVAEADATPGLEILVLWRNQAEVAVPQGISVYRVPDAAR